VALASAFFLMYSATAHSSLLPYSPPSLAYTAGQTRRPSYQLLLGQHHPDQKLAYPPRHDGSLSYHRVGLRTPPGDDNMNATYANPVLSNTYENHVALARQPHSMAPLTRAGRSTGEPLVNQQQHYSKAQSQQQQHYHQPQQLYPPQLTQHMPPLQHQSTTTYSQQSQSQPVSQSAVTTQQTQLYQSKPSAPTSQPRSQTQPKPVENVTASKWEGTVSKKESKMVTHSLEMPQCISPNGGRLDDFAALMTCFFWFETMDTIRSAEHIKDQRPNEPLPRLSQYTEPCSAYKKWVNGILATTQVTQNVVLLALLFVYRLKKTNPKVNGNPGSEYRLLTVALMLGNKFLDDNTYTNKTWAEVSGISVREIHVMEVEFLSNMRYGLLTSKDQWQDWLAKLACFHKYCETAKADDLRRQTASVAATLTAVSPSHSRFSSPLPSPTNILPSSMAGGSASLNAFSSNSPAQVPVAQNWPATYHPASVSAHAAKPSQGVARKRSLDGTADVFEPAAKRLPRQAPFTASRQHAVSNEATRSTLPQLSVDTNQTLIHQQAPAPVPQTTFHPQQYPLQQQQQQQRQQHLMPQQHSVPLQQQHQVSLPPLGQGMRAMATVYPAVSAPVTTWGSQAPIMAPAGPQTPTGIAASHFGTPTKRHSPGSVVHFASSPLADPYAALTPISNSPSIYLQQRASPYKPIRRVNTLLYPPPSMPLSEYHLGSTQMHYQPLGRRNDLRTGIVPEFLGSGQMQSRYLTHTPNQQQQQQPQGHAQQPQSHLHQHQQPHY